MDLPLPDGPVIAIARPASNRSDVECRIVSGPAPLGDGAGHVDELDHPPPPMESTTMRMRGYSMSAITREPASFGMDAVGLVHRGIPGHSF